MAGPSVGPDRGPRKVSDRLGGFNPDAIRQRSKAFPLGHSTFVAPTDGWYEWHLLGGGGSGRVNANNASSEGPSGRGAAYAFKRVFLFANASIPVSVGGGAVNSRAGSDGGPGADTVVTLPTGEVRAGAGAYTVPGVASGGDLNVSGVGAAPGSNPIEQPIPPGVFSNASTHGAGGQGSIGPRASIAGDGACVVLWQEERK